MALKKLSQFENFDINLFVAQKRLITTSIRKWNDYETGKYCGTRVELGIALDKTQYVVENGEAVSNLFEKITVKIPKTIELPLNVEVRLVNPVASVYGKYRNELSVTADDLELVTK